MECAFCRKTLDLPTGERIGRRDVCSHCGRDLHCCMQCKFYDPRAYNECREVAAERVVDKERANFCDYFLIQGSALQSRNKAEEAKKALEALFKK